MQNRMIFKVMSTGLNFILSIVIGILVPRAIGPESYGEFNYIISTYAFIFQLLMLTSGTAYIYFLSYGKHKIEDINTVYMFFLITISLFALMLGLLSINSELGIKYIWNGLDNSYLLYLGLVFGLFANLQQRLIEFSDSTSQTVLSESLKLGSRVLMILSILALIFMRKLDVYWFFGLSIFNFLFFFILFFRYVKFKLSIVRITELKNIINDFYVYLKPLIMFTVIAAFYSYLGKYVLQSSSGSIEQGYYNFAYQLALIPVTFISSVMAIYMSEMTKRFQVNDIIGVKNIFLNNIFKVYSLHAFIVFFILINSESIILLTVGDKYLGANDALEVLSIFSLLHTFGMLSGNLFFSSGRNKQYSMINSFVMIFGIAYLSYLLFFSMINAKELAFTMLFFYMVRVIIQLYFNFVYLRINIAKFILELFIVSFIIYLNLKLINVMGLNILINLLFSIS